MTERVLTDGIFKGLPYEYVLTGLETGAGEVRAYGMAHLPPEIGDLTPEQFWMVITWNVEGCMQEIKFIHEYRVVRPMEWTMKVAPILPLEESDKE